MVIMTAAAKLRENAMERRIVEGLKQNTTDAPTQVEAPARHDRSNGNFQEDAAVDAADAAIAIVPSGPTPSLLLWLSSNPPATPPNVSVNVSINADVNDANRSSSSIAYAKQYCTTQRRCVVRMICLHNCRAVHVFLAPLRGIARHQ
mmetsp:Transcript_15496/g.33485  ORF Transcript_15496/g.33485 Transcript_15496/m.33485 type:complete len:147 (-) Transcript_15496:155-595(-)